MRQKIFRKRKITFFQRPVRASGLANEPTYVASKVNTYFPRSILFLRMLALEASPVLGQPARYLVARRSDLVRRLIRDRILVSGRFQ